MFGEFLNLSGVLVGIRDCVAVVDAGAGAGAGLLSSVFWGSFRLVAG